MVSSMRAMKKEAFQESLETIIELTTDPDSDYEDLHQIVVECEVVWMMLGGDDVEEIYPEQ